MCLLNIIRFAYPPPIEGGLRTTSSWPRLGRSDDLDWTGVKSGGDVVRDNIGG